MCSFLVTGDSVRCGMEVGGVLLIAGYTDIIL